MKKLLLAAFALAGTAIPNFFASAACKFDQNSNELCNPLPDSNLQGIVVRGLEYALGAIGSIAIIVIIVAGFRMVLSQGNAEAVKSAKNSITWAIIGLLVAFLAYTIIAIVQNALIPSA